MDPSGASAVRADGLIRYASMSASALSAVFALLLEVGLVDEWTYRVTHQDVEEDSF